MKTINPYNLFFLLALVFSCSEIKKDIKRHENRIDSIQVLTLQKDTVWIYSNGTGHITILPNKSKNE